MYIYFCVCVDFNCFGIGFSVEYVLKVYHQVVSSVCKKMTTRRCSFLEVEWIEGRWDHWLRHTKAYIALQRVTTRVGA